MPDLMKDMMKQKKNRTSSIRANCAWVPSPTAAALHVLHYHESMSLLNKKNYQKKNRKTLRSFNYSS